MRIVVLDTTAGSLSTLWRLGSVISGAEVVVRAASWSEAYDGIGDALERASVPVRLDLQIWGHGDDGAPLIDGHSVSLAALRREIGVVDRTSTVWWRSCEVHRGPRGRLFAKQTTEVLGCCSVGHCAVISAPNPLVQGAICALRPGQEPWWDPAGKGLRGCSTLRMAVPSWAFRSTS